MLVGLVGSAVYTVRQDRQTVRYPGAVLVDRHSRYQPWPGHILWVSAYHTSDPVWKVYNWYTKELSLSPPSLVDDGCLYLQGYKRRFYIARSTSVVLCETPQGQTIKVMRLTLIW